MSPKDRLIIALDVPTLDHAEKTVREIGGAGHFYKIGYQLLPLGGYDLARNLSAQGKKVFLDVKMFDIGATVERGVQSLVPIGADILTVHTDEDTIKGAVAGRGDDPRLKIFAVTVLTSWDHRAIQKHGLPHSVMDLVLFRAEMALEAGADGVIASAQEASAIKKQFGDALKIVTPGIRPAGSGA
ncbi:MAG: orotidine-5'-phosphate decarboxylase, partial [Pseudomonadota bacterium]